MKKLSETKSAFANGTITKPEFIEIMFKDHHQHLFDYADYIPQTNIRKIEIEDGRVITTSRDKGIRISCGYGDYRIAPIESLNFLDYEKEESDILHALIGDDYTIFDIGANIGWYSISFALLKRSITIHSFEPIPKTYSQLCANVSLNPVAAQIKLNNFGLSDKDADLVFYYYPEGSGNASSANLSGRTDAEEIRCSVKTLDGYASENGLTIDFIKCDVEGAELFTFQGGMKTITRDKPVVFSEILRKWSAKFNYNPNEIFRLFASIGYQCYTVKNNTLVSFSEMDDSTVETNFFFLHPEKHRREISRFTV